MGYVHKRVKKLNGDNQRKSFKVPRNEQKITRSYSGFSNLENDLKNI